MANINSVNFNKKIFALLLDRAKGERSLRRFASDCDISYVQMRKLAMGEQDNPPRMKLIEKLGQNSQNDITAEDFAFAAGYGMAYYGAYIINSNIYKKFASLKARQRKDTEAYIDYLIYINSGKKSARSEKKDKSNCDK